MSRKLILIRHSAVETNPDVMSKLWRLSENGRFLTHQLAPKIARHQPTQIFTSTEPKAIETGQIIADELGVPCLCAPDLHEHDRTNVPFYPTIEAFHAVVTQFFQQPDELVFGEETAVTTQTRFANAVNNIMTTNPTGNIAIVTHGTVLTLFAAHYLANFDSISFWKSLMLPCAFVTTWPNVSELELID